MATEKFIVRSATLPKEGTVESLYGCLKCNHISCVCHFKDAHEPECKFRRAATCAVGIECEHGRDVCPICDPCTCTSRTAT